MPSTPGQAPTSAPATHAYLPLGIAAVLVGGLLSTLNIRLLGVGQPDFRGALSLSVDQAAWISTAFNMAIMFIGAFSVYLGGILGVRRVLLTCSLVYALVSLLMPFASGYYPLLALQVVAGLSSGTFYPLTLSFILASLPPRLIPIGLAAYSIAILFALNIASSVSAWYTNVLSWRWLFWNGAWIAPIMFLCVYFGMPHTPLPERKAAGPSWRGLLYWSFGLALIYGALDEGERVHWFDSPSYAALLFSGLFLVFMSIVRRRQDPNPLIALRFIRNRSTILLAVILFAFRFFLLSSAFLVPQFLESVKGFRNEQIGPVLSIVALLQLAIAWVTASALREVNSRLIMAIGFFVIGLTTFYCSHLSSVWAPNTYTPIAVFLAIGESVAMLGLVASIILNILGSGAIAPSGKPKRPGDILTFSGFFHTVRIMGGQIGTILMLHFINQRDKFHVDILAQQTAISRQSVSYFVHGAVAALTPQSSDPAHGLNLTSYFLGATVHQQAATLAFADGFTLIAWSTIAALAVIAFIRLSIPSFKRLA